MLNLLPPTEKETLLWEERQRMSILFGMVVFVFLFSLVLVLFIGEIRIGAEEESERVLLEAEKAAFRVSGFEEVQKKAAAYKKMLVSFKEFSAGATDITELAEVLAKSLPPGVYLTFLSYEKENASLMVSGFAPTRADLFTFKQNLEREPLFAAVDFPPSSWINSTDIVFQATLKIAQPKTEK